MKDILKIEIKGKIVEFNLGQLQIETKDGLIYSLDIIDPMDPRKWCQKRIKKNIKLTVELKEI